MSRLSEYKTQDLGHPGLVAGMCRELKIAETIDRLLPPTQKQISHGNAVCAMVLNGPGFVNQQLCLIPEFFRNKPAGRLLGEGIAAEQLNDDTLGRTTDAIHEAGPAEIYGAVASETCHISGLRPRFAHMDSTSFHTDGRYNSEQPGEEGVIRITKGYSRDHRPELNQCVLNLISESQASIPVHMSAANGNSEDKKGFRELLSTHIDSLQNVHEFRYVVADSALYAEETLGEFSETLMFISRVPSTLSAVKELSDRTDISLMHRIDENCSCLEVCGIYGGVRQRWIIIRSMQAFERDIQSLNRRFLKGSERELKDFAKLCCRPFACREDAEREWEKFQKTLRHTCVCNLQIRQQARYGKRGKPKNGEHPERTEYFLKGDTASCLNKRSQSVRTGGMFVLATNELSDQRLPAPEALTGYKGQSHVEKGFRFLKNPEFPADSLFLKKPERITSLLMIMTVCLMVYAALEYRIRKGLQEQGDTVGSQTGKPTDRPTARWIFHCFTGIHILYHNGLFTGIMNLNGDHRKIIDLLGYRSFYT